MKICWAQYLLWLAIAVPGMGSVLTACGQKGDLYLLDSTTAAKEPLVAREHTAKKKPLATIEPSS